MNKIGFDYDVNNEYVNREILWAQRTAGLCGIAFFIAVVVRIITM